MTPEVELSKLIETVSLHCRNISHTIEIPMRSFILRLKAFVHYKIQRAHLNFEKAWLIVVMKPNNYYILLVYYFVNKQKECICLLLALFFFRNTIYIQTNLCLFKGNGYLFIT